MERPAATDLKFSNAKMLDNQEQPSLGLSYQHLRAPMIRSRGFYCFSPPSFSSLISTNDPLYDLRNYLIDEFIFLGKLIRKGFFRHEVKQNKFFYKSSFGNIYLSLLGYPQVHFTLPPTLGRSFSSTPLPGFVIKFEWPAYDAS